jgi:hypothetical protein
LAKDTFMFQFQGKRKQMAIKFRSAATKNARKHKSLSFASANPLSIAIWIA